MPSVVEEGGAGTRLQFRPQEITFRHTCVLTPGVAITVPKQIGTRRKLHTYLFPVSVCYQVVVPTLRACATAVVAASCFRSVQISNAEGHCNRVEY